MRATVDGQIFLFATKKPEKNLFSGSSFTGIDHVVLNVEAGDLEPAVAWYQDTLGFQAKQAFKIQTERSALHSQVMVSPNHQVQLPIHPDHTR